ncbi:MAG: phosphate acetyltransferase [Actinomycetia bacterium]|nr:phosphate acetyltransferase [Actinomycetes bacterium]
MTDALYLTALEPDSGKTLVALGVMDLLTREVQRVGYFRPVSRGADDPRAALVRERYRLAQRLEDSFGITTAQTRSIAGPDDITAAVDVVLSRFEALARGCDVVLVEGTDYTGASAAFEFEINAAVARNLGTPMLVVVRARDRRPVEVAGAVQAARASLDAHGLPLLGFVVNRVDPHALGEVAAAVPVGREPVWCVPEDTRLAQPTLREVAEATGARLVAGDDADLAREVAAVKVGAMSLPNLLAGLSPDTLVITPGDRADVVVAASAVRYSRGAPQVVGLLLTGGFEPEHSVRTLLHGLTDGHPPLLVCDHDTYTAAQLVGDARPTITATDQRRIDTCLTLFGDHVDISDLAQRIALTRSAHVTPLMFEHRLLDAARERRMRIVLPEGTDDRILEAADRVLRREIADLTILGDPAAVTERARRLGLDLAGATLLDPETEQVLRQEYAEELARLRAAKGMALDAAWDALADVNTFGVMLVHAGRADGMVSGAAHTTAATIRPALQVIRNAPGVSVVSSVFFMALADRVLVYGDCAVNPDPDAEQLADIAVSSARTAAAFGVEPYVAMLSYSTGSSGSGDDVVKVSEATRLARLKAPDLPIDGPIQYDAAIDPRVAASKMPGSPVAGRATVFVFPDLNTGNNTYKAVQRSAGALAIGPVMQGLRRPVNDLSRGATVADIVNTIAITAIQAAQLGA